MHKVNRTFNMKHFYSGKVNSTLVASNKKSEVRSMSVASSGVKFFIVFLLFIFSIVQINAQTPVTPTYTGGTTTTTTVVIGTETFLEYRYFSGSGSTTNNNAKITVTGNCTIILYATGGNNSTSNRNFIVTGGSYSESKTNNKNSAPVTYSYTGGAGTVTIYPTGGGGTIYGIYLIYPCTAGTPSGLVKTANCDGTADLSYTDTPASGDVWYWQTSATGTANNASPYTVSSANTYYLRAYNAAGDCWGTATSISVTTTDLAVAPSITSENFVQLPNTLTLTGSPAGGTWSVINGTGSASITGGNILNPSAEGTVTVTYTLNGCPTQQTVTIITSAPCDAITDSFSVTGSTTICSEISATISLSGSEIGVSYKLYNGSIQVGSVVAGTGDPISFDIVSPTTTTYTVKGYGTNGIFCTPEVAMQGNAVITVNPATAISTQPQGATYTVNDIPNALSATASGTGTLTYQWYKNTTNTTVGATLIYGATTATLSASNISTATPGSTFYYVIVSGDCGTPVTSDIVEVKVNSCAANCPYTYQCEGFESGWTTNTSSTPINQNVSTGTWSLAGGTVSTTPVRGNYSMRRSSSSFILRTPILSTGAGELTVYAHPNGSTARTITIKAYNSSDAQIFTETKTTTSNAWVQYSFEINRIDAHYITIEGNNNSLYFDDICITSGLGPCSVTTSVPSVSNLGYEEGESPVPQSFTVTWANLLSNILTLTPPANFEISVDGGTIWNSDQVLYTVPSTTAGSVEVLVRLASGLTPSEIPYSGIVTITTTQAGCENTVAVNGTVLAAGSCYFIMPEEVSGLDYEEGGTSPEKGISISWKNLSSDTIIIRPPDNFEISVNDEEWTSAEVNYPIEIEDQIQGSVPVKVRLLKGLSPSIYTGSLIVTAEDDVTCTNSTTMNGVVVPSIVLPVECVDGIPITTNWALTTNNNPSTEITDNIIGEAVVLGANVRASAGNNSDGTRLKSSGSWPAPATEGYHLDIPFSVLEGKNATINSISCTIKTSSGTAATSYLLQYSIDGGDFHDFDTQIGPTSSGQSVSVTFTSSTPVLLGSEQRVVFRLLPVGSSSNSRNIYIKNITIGGTTCDESPIPSTLHVSTTSLSGFTSDGCLNNVQSFTVTGSNLRPVSGTINLTGAADYEYSLVSDFTSTLTEVPYSGGEIDQLVYVRLKQGKSAGNYNQTVTVSGGGYAGTPLEIALSGTSTGNTTISFASALSGFTYVDTDGGPSTSQQGTLSWTAIPVGSTINLSMLHSNFEFSLDGTNFSNPSNFTTETSPRTIYFRLKAGLEVGNYTDTLVAQYDCYTAKQILSGTVTSGTGCLFTASTYSVSDLKYPLSAGPSEIKTVTITIANYAAANNPTVTLSNTNFQYSFNGSDWISSSSTSRSELKIANGTVTMYIRLRSGRNVGIYEGILSIRPSNCGQVDINLSGEVYEVPVIVIKNDKNREIEMVCEDAISGNPTITLTADKTSTGPWLWEYNNDNNGWETLPQNSKTISLSPPNGITVYRVTINGISTEKVFRTMVCCAVVGNSQLIFSDDFGALEGTARRSDPSVTSSYSYAASGETKDGMYSVVNNPRVANGPESYWKDMPDHTGNTNGAMLVFNGSAPGQIAYSRTYPDLCPNTLYNFSAWVVNLHRSTDTNRPRLTFNILDSDRNVLATTSTGEIGINEGWIENSVTFNSGTGGQTIILEIVSYQPSGGGNDFGIDDVVFTSCTPETFLTVDGLRAIDYVLCDGDRELRMVSNCDYDIQAFYPSASYGFLYRKKMPTDVGPDTEFRDWILADWPQLNNEYIFDTSVLDEGETYSFMSVTANSSLTVQKVIDYYTGDAATLILETCEKYSASTVSQVRKPDIPDIEVQMNQDTVCIKDGGTITASIRQLNEADPVTLTEGRFDVDEEGLAITTSTNLSFVVDVAGSEPGTYEISYFLPGDAGDTEVNVCDEFTYRHTIVILDETMPSVTIEVDKDTVCINSGGVVFTATPTDEGENPSYQWYLNGIEVGTNSSTYANTNIANGDEVYCVVTNTDLCGSSAISNTITITVEDPTVEITSDNGITLSCILGSITLIATPSIESTYEWLPGGETTSTKIVTATGTYSVTTTTANGCTAVDDITIDYQDPPAPNLVITNPDLVCEPNTVDITVAAITEGSSNTGTLSYWKDEDENESLNNPDAISESGIYYIKTSPNACGVTDKEPVVVIIDPLPSTSEISHN